MAYLFKGENDNAIETLKEFQKKTGDPLKGQISLCYAYSVAFFLKTHPFAENIKNDPRFNELLIKAGFKE